jgi:hypothetical protein
MKFRPIGLNDLVNPNAMHDVIKSYFDELPHANWVPGVLIYDIRVHFQQT